MARVTAIADTWVLPRSPWPGFGRSPAVDAVSALRDGSGRELGPAMTGTFLVSGHRSLIPVSGVPDARYTPAIMQMTTLAPATYRRMPWKNGLGETTELVRTPQDGDPDWRISIARVTADGPFSHYPGYDRVILALDGDGMVLTHHDTGTEVAIGVLEPWDFSGDLTTSCVVRGEPFRDFNVFTRRGAFTAEVRVLELTKAKTLSVASHATILYCVEGSIVLGGTDRIELQSDETAVIEATSSDESLTIEPSGLRATVVQVELARR